MKKLLFVLLLFVCTSSVFSQTYKGAAVWTNVEALHKAIFETKDSVVIQKLVADSVTYGHSTGLLENKPAMLHNAVHTLEDYKNLSFERLSATHAGSTVIVRFIFRAEVTKEGATNPLNLSIIQVWGKDKGNWRLFARQAVKIAPKA